MEYSYDKNIFIKKPMISEVFLTWYSGYLMFWTTQQHSLFLWVGWFSLPLSTVHNLGNMSTLWRVSHHLHRGNPPPLPRHHQRLILVVDKIPWATELYNLPQSYNLVQFSHSVVSDSLRPHELQHARLPCLSPTHGVCSNSCPSSRRCHPTNSCFVAPFSSCLQSFPASGSSLMNHFFTSGGQSIDTSASVSVLSRNIHNWFPLGLTGLISLQSKGLSRVFSNTTVQKHQFFSPQPSLRFNSNIIHDYWKNHSFDYTPPLHT